VISKLFLLNFTVHLSSSIPTNSFNEMLIGVRTHEVWLHYQIGYITTATINALMYDIEKSLRKSHWKVFVAFVERRWCWITNGWNRNKSDYDKIMHSTQSEINLIKLGKLAVHHLKDSPHVLLLLWLPWVPQIGGHWITFGFAALLMLTK